MNHSPDDARSVIHDLVATARAAERRIEVDVERESGLSLAQLDFLEPLSQCESGLPLGKVAEELCCVRSNVTQLADRLESQGWIVRQQDPSDRRCVRAVLTNEGRERVLRGTAARNRATEILAGGLENNGYEAVLRQIRSRA